MQEGCQLGAQGSAAKIRGRLNQQPGLVVASVCVCVCCLRAGADQKSDPAGFPVPLGP